ncbi:peptidoglycan amidohydrolase family protein [Enterococcus sp. AZ109]|uniref:peptidoglycan amidohydrolase family protein n=1 Tax=Enterococcus sp. AZ109 TaxID=2774634 RepID=UPI003F261D39
MGDINKFINWFKTREGKVTYSMANRLGPNSYDCSSAVFYALIEAGFLPAGTWPGNTESLYALEGNLLTPINRSQVQAGDIFVAGIKGGSLGADGHTGVALSNNMIIHCNYAGNGINTTGISNNTTYYPCHWYRLNGVTTTNSSSNNTTTKIETKPKKKRGNVMLLFRAANDPKVYFLVGNQYTHVKNQDHLDEIKVMMEKAGYDTHIHTSLTQIEYIKKIAKEGK